MTGQTDDRPNAPPDDRSNDRQAGFTVIEMLVGLALLALTVTLLPGTLRLGTQAWQTRAELERGAGLTAAMAMLEQRIAAALPAYGLGPSGVGVLFAGDSRSLGFVSAAENGPAGAGVYRYRLEPGDGGTGVMLRMSPYSPALADPQADPQADPAAARTVDAAVTRLLFPGHALRFRYFGAQPADAPPQWHDSWQQPDALPALVDMTLGTVPPRRLLVAPRLLPAN